MTMRYFLTEYTEEGYPAEAPTLEAWAAWLHDPRLNTEWGRTEPAKPGEEFEGYATAAVAHFTFTVGDEIPHSAVAWDWCCLDDDWEASGATLAEAITELDDGEEVSITCYRDAQRRYRYDLVDGVPTLTDTDPATAPTSAAAVRDAEQAVLL